MGDKAYLGESRRAGFGIYAIIDNLSGSLVLTTENEIETTNTIWLEPKVIAALLVFLKRNIEKEI